MNRTDDATEIVGGPDGDTIAPTLAAFENSQIRLAIGYSDGGIVCNEGELHWWLRRSGHDDRVSIWSESQSSIATSLLGFVG